MNNYKSVLLVIKKAINIVKQAVLSKKTLLGLALRPYAAQAQWHLRERKQNAAVIFNAITLHVACIKFAEILILKLAVAPLAVMPLAVFLPPLVVGWLMCYRFKVIVKVFKRTSVGLMLGVTIWCLNYMGASGGSLWPLSAAYAVFCWWSHHIKRN